MSKQRGCPVRHQDTTTTTASHPTTESNDNNTEANNSKNGSKHQQIQRQPPTETKEHASKQKRKKQNFHLGREERDLQEALERSRNDVMGQPAAVVRPRNEDYVSSVDEEEQAAAFAHFEALQDAKHGAHLQGAATNADARAAAGDAATRRRVSWENYGRPR